MLYALIPALAGLSLAVGTVVAAVIKTLGRQ